MGDDVTTDGLLRVGIEHGAGSVYLGDNLVGDDHGHSKLIGKAEEGTEESGKMHLAGRQFTTTTIIGTVEGSGAVNNEQSVSGFSHHCAGLDQKGGLVIRIVSTSVRNIVEDLITIQPKSTSNLHKPLRSKGSFRINVKALSGSASLLDGELTGDSQGVANLSFTRSKLSKKFRDGTSFETAAQQVIQLLGTSGDVDDFLATLVEVGGGGEAHGDEAGSFSEDFVGLGFADTFDEEDGLLGGVGDGFDRVEAGFDQLLDVSGTDTALLNSN